MHPRIMLPLQLDQIGVLILILTSYYSNNLGNISLEIFTCTSLGVFVQNVGKQASQRCFKMESFRTEEVVLPKEIGRTEEPGTTKLGGERNEEQRNWEQRGNRNKEI